MPIMVFDQIILSTNYNYLLSIERILLNGHYARYVKMIMLLGLNSKLKKKIVNMPDDKIAKNKSIFHHQYLDAES